MQYVYPCDFTPDEEEGSGFVVSFPDIPPAITGGKNFKESIILAEDALVVALSIYVDRQEDLPAPSSWKKGQELISVQPLIAAQLDLYTAMRQQEITVEDLAQALKIPASDARKLLILDYKTSINQVFTALAEVGAKAAVEETVA